MDSDHIFRSRGDKPSLVLPLTLTLLLSLGKQALKPVCRINIILIIILITYLDKDF
jgi:hypothetical protein